MARGLGRWIAPAAVVVLLVAALLVVVFVRMRPSGLTDAGAGPHPAERTSAKDFAAESSERATRAELPGAVPSEAPNDDAEGEVAVRRSGSVRIRTLWAQDRSPVQHVRLRIIHGESEAWVQCDGEGRAQIDDVGADEITLHSLLGSWQSFPLAVGEVNELEYLLEDGLTVRGRVMDAEGSPVAGAGIWLGADGSSVVGGIVAHSGGDGRFEVRCSETSISMGAHAPRHGPSLRHFLDGEPGEVLSAEFVLTSDGGEVRGVVLDGDGRPVVGARILVGTGVVRTVTKDDGEMANLPTTQVVHSGVDGTFALYGVAHGVQPVAVRLGGFGIFTTEVEVGPHEAAHVVAQLGPGGTVLGRVTDESGKALAGASVGRDLSNLPTFFAQWTATDSEGAFRLEHLPLSDVRLRVAHASAIGDSATFALEDETPVRWDPVLPLKHQILGQLLGDDGVARVGWKVGTDGTRGTVSSDGEGRFRMTMPSADPAELRVWPRGSEVGAPAVRFAGITPGPEEQEFVVSEGVLPRGTIRGTILNADGAPADGEIRMRGAKPSAILLVEVDDETGSFEVRSLTEGRYTLQFDGRQLPEFDLDPVDLLRDEVSDLETVRLPETGRVVVDVGPESLVTGPLVGAPGEERLSLFAESADHPSSVLVLDGTRATSPPLYAGEYDLSVYGQVLDQTIPFTVRSGEETRLAIDVERAVRLWIRWTMAVDRKLPGHVAFDVTAETGDVVLSRVDDIGDDRSPADADVLNLRWSSFALRPGSYQIDARTDTGLRATARVSLSFTEEPDSLTLRLE